MLTLEQQISGPVCAHALKVNIMIRFSELVLLAQMHVQRVGERTTTSVSLVKLGSFITTSKIHVMMLLHVEMGSEIIWRIVMMGIWIMGMGARLTVKLRLDGHVQGVILLIRIIVRYLVMGEMDIMGFMSVEMEI